jgi:MFS family permease
MFKFVKIILSIVLVLIIGFVINSVFEKNGLTFTVAIGVSSGCIFMLAMLWAGRQLESDRFGAFGAFFIGLCALGLGLSIGSDNYPKLCNVPKPRNCLSMNTVAEVGGSWLVAAPVLIFGIFLLVFAVVFFRKKTI